MLRALGGDFTTLTTAQASVINVPAYPTTQRPLIGKASDDTSWLTGDEIIQLVSRNNPDGVGVHPDWLRGPAHLGYFHTFFAQTLTQPAMHGMVHIMVVNTYHDTREFSEAAQAPMHGRH